MRTTHILAVATAGVLATVGLHPGSAGVANAQASATTVTAVTADATLQQFEQELQSLEGMTQSEIDDVVAQNLALSSDSEPTPRIAPAVLIPLLIGCGVSTASGLSSLSGSGWRWC